MTKPIITVVGGTGAQGGGVVDALLASGRHAVRVVSRDPTSEASERLKKRDVEVTRGDLLDPKSLRTAFEGSQGAFLMTNFWDPAQMWKETEIGKAAVKEARAAGVEHFVWSTLPDAQKLTRGRSNPRHLTEKSRVDEDVVAAGFPRFTFVHAPFYFQNLLGALGPQPLPTGGRGWAVPMDPAARVIHAGDVKDVGRAVAAAFLAGDKLRNGSHLAVCGGTYSWGDFASTLNAQGHALRVEQVSPEAYDRFYPGASEMREMFQYFEECTYFGPERDARIEAANALYPAGFVGFAQWARTNFPPP